MAQRNKKLLYGGVYIVNPKKHKRHRVQPWTLTMTSAIYRRFGLPSVVRCHYLCSKRSSWVVLMAGKVIWVGVLVPAPAAKNNPTLNLTRVFSKRWVRF